MDLESLRKWAELVALPVIGWGWRERARARKARTKWEGGVDRNIRRLRGRTRRLEEEKDRHDEVLKSIDAKLSVLPSMDAKVNLLMKERGLE